jgi:hypothetical protein
MKRFGWVTLLALAGVLVVGGMAVAQERPMTAAERSAEVELARLAEIQADREGKIAELVAMWAPRGGAEAEQLEMTLRAAKPAQLLRVSAAESFDAVERILLGAGAGAPFGGVLPNDLGDTSQDYVYTPVTPCRIFDTRNAGGSISAGTTREFYVYGTSTIAAQGGNPSGCAAPQGEPRAVHLNVTVVPVGTQGNVRVYPANVATPGASAVNFKLGTNIANALTVGTYYALGTPREIEVFAGAGDAHVLADVLGYYYNVGPGLVQTEHAGYDLSGGLATITTTTQTMWNAGASSSYGGGPVTVASGQVVLVDVSCNIYKSDADPTTDVFAELEPCYSTSSSYTNPTGTPFEGSTRGHWQSTGIADMNRISASYRFTGLSGTYYFSLCLRRLSTSTSYADFSAYAPKVSVRVINE